MPELPECDVMVTYLRSLKLEDDYLVNAVALHHSFNKSVDELKHAYGTSIRLVARKAKYILFDTDNGVIVVHNKFTGYLSSPTEPFTFDYLEYDRPVTQKDLRLVLYFASGRVLNFHDARCLGLVRYEDCPASEIPYLTHMGEDVVLTPNTHPSFNKPWHFEYLLAKADRAKQDIKSFMLDQTNQAGIGNIYVCEALFACGINPKARTCDVMEDGRLMSLYCAVHRLMDTAISKKVEYDEYIKVFRAKICCRCGGKIERMEQANRGTYWCKVCQV